MQTFVKVAHTFKQAGDYPCCEDCHIYLIDDAGVQVTAHARGDRCSCALHRNINIEELEVFVRWSNNWKPRDVTIQRCTACGRAWWGAPYQARLYL